MHWSDKYPHDLHASVILKNGKIKIWKVGNGKLSEKYNVKHLETERPHYSYQEKTWIVQDRYEHNDVFSKHAPEWFRQWPHSDEYIGFPAYSTHAAPSESDDLTGEWTTDLCPKCGAVLLANRRGDKWCSNTGGQSMSACDYGLK